VIFELPQGVQLSGTFQSNPGPTIRALYNVTSAMASPSLGRPLSAGVTTIDLIQPNSLIGQRMYQVDTRLAKSFKIPGGRGRIKATVDLFNVFNNNAALLENPTYGPLWQQPTVVLPGRLVKFGAEVSF
jgi:hypothetical protein